MSPSWPLEMLSTFTFTERDGKTTFTVKWAPYNCDREERKTFDGAHGGMTQGWTGTLDQLAEYLAKAQQKYDDVNTEEEFHVHQHSHRGCRDHCCVCHHRRHAAG